MCTLCLTLQESYSVYFHFSDNSWHPSPLAAVFLLRTSQRELIHQTVRAALWRLPVDFLLIMFEILPEVLFSVRAISLIVALFISRPAAPRGSLCLLISWLVCLRLNTFSPCTLLREITVCTAQLYRTPQKGNTMCTHAPGGDVKINVVSFSPIIHPLPPSFPLQHLKSASILVAARNAQCITKGTASCLSEDFWREMWSRKCLEQPVWRFVWPGHGVNCHRVVLVSDTEQESCGFFFFVWHCSCIIFPWVSPARCYFSL